MAGAGLNTNATATATSTSANGPSTLGIQFGALTSGGTNVFETPGSVVALPGVDTTSAASSSSTSLSTYLLWAILATVVAGLIFWFIRRKK